MCPPPDGSAIVSGLIIGAALVGGCSKPAPAPGTAPVQVAAAADLSVAFEEMGQLFRARTGQTVTFSFGASGALAKQLAQGAPFDLFAAANTAFVDSAVQAGACDGTTKALYALGHVVAWSKSDGVKLATLSDLKSDAIQHVAIANPEHAPYGKAAKQALQQSGLWQELEPKIVLAENVRQALQFAQTGNAEVAMVALSLVSRDRGGNVFALDPALHAPIEQTLVVCKHGKNSQGAKQFAELVESQEGQALLQRYGFGGSAEKPSQ